MVHPDTKAAHSLGGSSVALCFQQHLHLQITAGSQPHTLLLQIAALLLRVAWRLQEAMRRQIPWHSTVAGAQIMGMALLLRVARRLLRRAVLRWIRSRRVAMVLRIPY